MPACARIRSGTRPHASPAPPPVGFENARLYEQLQAYAEEAELSAERYSALYHNTPVMMHSINDDGELIRVNDYWLRMLGYQREEVLGRLSVEFLTESSRKRALEQVLPQLRATGSIRDFEMQMVKRNGDILDVLGSASAKLDEEGRIAQTMAFFVDVTDRKKAEERLRQSEARFAGVFQSAMDAIVIIDSGGSGSQGVVPYLPLPEVQKRIRGPAK